MRVLVVEDDLELQSVLENGFREQHLEVVTAGTYVGGRREAALNTFGVIVLDLMLPDGTGIDLCRHLRAHGDTTPILLLTGRDGIDDRVAGLDSGADDYLVKPFAFRELLARVHALARRQPGLQPTIHTMADLTVDLRTREVQRAHRTIDLTAKEFELLECFVTHPDAVLNRATITAHVWDDNHDPLSNALEVLIRRLRQKIDDDFRPHLIHTIRGAGYRFGV